MYHLLLDQLSDANKCDGQHDSKLRPIKKVMLFAITHTEICLFAAFYFWNKIYIHMYNSNLQHK